MLRTAFSDSSLTGRSLALKSTSKISKALLEGGAPLLLTLTFSGYTAVQTRIKLPPISELFSSRHAALVSVQSPTSASEDSYLSWSAQQAKEIGKSMRSTGKVSAGQGLTHTERAISYKLRATWMTPEVIRAASRLLQLGNRLTDDQARALVAEAEEVGETVVMVELDPREGSGVIPLGWQAFLRPKGVNSSESRPVAGINNPKLREVKALAGVMQRDYDYDSFWMVFPLINENGGPIFSDSDEEAELIVRIYGKEGKVAWPIPDSIRRRINDFAKKRER